MAKYEIDLLVKGSLTEAAAESSIKEIVGLINKQKDFNEDKWGNKLLAYKIRKETNAYYFIYTFDCEEPAILVEFRRLCNINDNILRSLIINLEKCYGYKASINPNKVAKAKLMNDKYKKRQEEWKNKKNEAAVVDTVLNLSEVADEEEIENE
ncbi:MAG: 30S ribosomal protein S6 [Mycoplasmataceae bacterium]|nr:30S ribosomal protein S6 [Mycoplasmataceae bacterium]